MFMIENGTFKKACTYCQQRIDGEAVNVPHRLGSKADPTQLSLDHYHPECAARILYEYENPEGDLGEVLALRKPSEMRREGPLQQFLDALVRNEDGNTPRVKQ